MSLIQYIGHINNSNLFFKSIPFADMPLLRTQTQILFLKNIQYKITYSICKKLCSIIIRNLIVEWKMILDCNSTSITIINCIILKLITVFNKY